ncbi:MAG: hypothetical protein JWO56_2479 [Acidobacteria bacterium]|nr:hypothetical protein [Acidobacteriota bacterium]
MFSSPVMTEFLASPSLYEGGMRHPAPHDRRCTYVVPLGETAGGSVDELRTLAAYLSTLSVANCDVLILDAASSELFERNRTILRWVGRHVATGPRDPVRAAVALAACEKVILAGADVRYTAAEVEAVCALLNQHEVVEPQDYLDPLPWWGGIEAGRILVHRSIEPYPDHGATFGFRRSAVRGLRGLDLLDCGDDHVRRLSAQGAEIHPALDLFVRRRPPELGHWLQERSRQAEDDFAMPVKSAFFFALIPMDILLTLFGGVQVEAGYCGAVAFAAVALAIRGRIGAAEVFPLRACLYAPLWILERSLSVYWALGMKMRGAAAEPHRVIVAEKTNARAASGQ